MPGLSDVGHLTQGGACCGWEGRRVPNWNGRHGSDDRGAIAILQPPGRNELRPYKRDGGAAGSVNTPPPFFCKCSF